MSKKHSNDPDSDTTLARRDERGGVLANRESRRELVEELDHEIRSPGGRQKAIQCIMRAARELAPVFSVMSVKNPNEHFADDSEVATLESTMVLIECLCSAAAYLANAKGISKADLLAKFEEWARDNGLE